MLRSGFEVEGRIREALWKEGAWVDVIWMGILKGDHDASINTGNRSTAFIPIF